ncbi:hypothetical protein D044_4017B, partial [Vibrio parahaemolyticus EKP-026]
FLKWKTVWHQDGT